MPWHLLPQCLSETSISPSSLFAAYEPPKLYSKNYYCISCAVHSRIVRVRNRQARRVREPPQRMRRQARD